MITVFTWLAVIVSMVFVGVMWTRHNKVDKWGRYILLLAVWGLFICCLAATRDGYDKSVQNMIDGSIQAGLFSVQSIQSTLCCILGAINFAVSFFAIFIKKQNIRKVIFFILGADVIIKVLIIEISRIILLF